MHSKPCKINFHMLFTSLLKVCELHLKVYALSQGKMRQLKVQDIKNNSKVALFFKSMRLRDKQVFLYYPKHNDMDK